MLRTKRRDDYRDRKPRQPSLFDNGENAKRTRADAHAAARPRMQSRRDAIELAVAAAGRSGLTRHELHELLSIPPTSVQSPVLDLIAAGRLHETERRRSTPYGRPAVVLVSVLLREGRDDG